MHNEIKKAQREIVIAFNSKPKEGINKIKKICHDHNIFLEEQIALFFHDQKKNLDLESVGDYLSGSEVENEKVLKEFTAQIDFQEKGFIEGLRVFLKTFKLPGEAQKIDRVIQSFSEAYYKQHSGGDIASKDAAYLLAFQSIMLNTDLHNPSIPEQKKMSLKGLKKNLRNCNNNTDFNEDFLSRLYHSIKKIPFELNFVKVSPGYELISNALNRDSIFKKLNLLLHTSKGKIQDIFPEIGGEIKATMDKPKSWLTHLSGYDGTITLINQETSKPLVTIQIYKPGFFSKWLFNKQPRVVIQPVYQDRTTPQNSTHTLGFFSQKEIIYPAGHDQETIDLAAKIAASFDFPVKSIKATYDYVRGDLLDAYVKQKIPVSSGGALRSSPP